MHTIDSFGTKLSRTTKKIIPTILFVVSAILSGHLSVGYCLADVTPPVTTATPPAGAYDSSQTVTLAASEPATIYYSTNGNDPTTDSSRYCSPIAIESSTTLKYFAVDTVGNREPVVTSTYTISRLGAISGRVTDGITGSGIQWILAIAYRQGTQDPPTVARTDTAGTYRITNLVAGTYQLYFAYAGNSNYLNQWYDNKPDQQSAGTVTVTEANTTTGINAVLYKGGKISGTVSDSLTGSGIPDVQVVAYNADNGSWTGSDLTDASGAFSIGGVASGGYKLKFVGVNHVNQWYKGKTDKASATVVTVIAPDVTSNVNVAMSMGAAISGTVTDLANGAALSGISVTAYNADTMEWVRHAFTDGNGAYRLGGLSPGRYEVSFSAMYGSDYLEQWHSGASDRTSATFITVTGKQAVNGINASMQRGGRISGKVTDIISGTAIPTTYLTVYRKDDGKWADSVLTDADGAYQTSPLPSGSYVIQAGCNDYLCQWYNGKASRDEATAIVVTAPSTTTGIDIVLTKGGGISGRITDRTSGAPIAGARLWVDDGNSTLWGTYQSGSDGSYTITGLPSGSYRLRVNPPSGSRYIGTWYGSEEGGESCPTTVTVTAPEITAGIDARLGMGGSVSGKIIDAVTGSGIAEARVLLTDNTSYILSYSLFDISADSGDYTINGIPPGTYSFDIYIPGYTRSGTASTISVSADETIVGVDIPLSKGGSIRGRVTDKATGRGIPDIRLTAYPEVPASRAGSGTTGADGTYSIDGLASGNYAISFTSSGENRYGSGWYVDNSAHAPVSPNADIIANNPTPVTTSTTVTSHYTQISDYPVSVIAPVATTGINMKLTSKGYIAGKVTDSNGTPLAMILVSANDAVTGYRISTTRTESDGTYTMGGLPSGTYWVNFSGIPIIPPSSNPGYLSRWYGQEGGIATRIAVSVSAPKTTDGIDATLAPAGGITGSIEINSCPEPEQFRVMLYDATTEKLVGQHYASTPSNHKFSITDLPSGSYKLLLVPYDSGFVQQWYPDKQDMTAAEPVTVTAGAFTDSINFSIATGGAGIAGLASISSGIPLSGSARLYDWYSGNLVSETSADSFGYYRLNGIPEGSYKLQFAGSHIDRWYRTPGETEQASLITVTGATSIKGINFLEQVVSDGDIDGSGKPDLRDVLQAMRIVTGLDKATPASLVHGDVAPITDGVSAPDGKITIADVLAILRLSIGLSR